MKTALPLALLGLLALTGCGNRPDSAPAPSDPKVNENATVTSPGAEPPAGRADAENPETGTNSSRPDSPRDLAPGTDGNTPPVR